MAMDSRVEIQQLESIDNDDDPILSQAPYTKDRRRHQRLTEGFI